MSDSSLSQLAARVTHLEQRMEDRLDHLETRLTSYDSIIGMFRWLGPVLVGVVGVLLGKFG